MPFQRPKFSTGIFRTSNEQGRGKSVRYPKSDGYMREDHSTKEWCYYEHDRDGFLIPIIWSKGWDAVTMERTAPELLSMNTSRAQKVQMRYRAIT